MTSRQRLQAALSLREPDRVPVSPYLLNPYNERDWRTRDPSFQEVLKLARETADLFGLAYPDGLGLFYSAPGSIPHTVTVREYAAGTLLRETTTQGGPPRYGDSAHYVTAGAAERILEETIVSTPLGPISALQRRDRGVDTVWTIKHFVETPHDLDAFLSLPFEPPQPSAAAALALDKLLGERGIAGLLMDDPLLPVADLFGTQAFLELAYTETKCIRRLLDLFQQRLLPIYDSLTRQGQGLFFRIAGPEYAGVPLMAPRFFRELVVPYDSELVRLVRGSGNWAAVHMHGRLRDNLAAIAEIHPHALEPIECLPFTTADVTLAEVKQRIGSEICLMGNIQEGLLDLGTQSEVETYVQQALDDGAPGGGFILIPTDVAFTPLSRRKAENLKAFLRAGTQSGMTVYGGGR